MLKNNLPTISWHRSICSLVACLTMACSENESVIEAHDKQVLPAIRSESLEVTAIEHAPTKTTLFLSIVDKHLNTLLIKAEELNKSLLIFAQTPTDDKLSSSIDELNDVHTLFSSWKSIILCCDSFRIIPETKSQESDYKIHLITRLDHYPLLPGYLDTVEGYPFSGLIYSDIPITRESMEKEFQLGDPAYVTLGFHALEAILKGHDSERKAEDFSILKSTDDTQSAPTQLRRTLYSILLAAEIKSDLTSLRNKWLSTKKKILGMSSKESDSFFKELHKAIEKELENIDLATADNEKQEVLKHDTADMLHLKKELIEQIKKVINKEP